MSAFSQKRTLTEQTDGVIYHFEEGSWGAAHFRSLSLALYNLAIDRKLRGCDVVSLKVGDVAPHGRLGFPISLWKRGSEGQTV